jgi:hypothetical protein
MGGPRPGGVRVEPGREFRPLVSASLGRVDAAAHELHGERGLARTAPGLASTEAGGTTLNGRIVLLPDTAQAVLERHYLTPDTLKAGEPDWAPTGNRICFSAQGPDSTR